MFICELAFLNDGKKVCIPLPYKSIITTVLIVLLLLPWLLYQYNMIGYPVTDSRQVSIITKVMDLFSINYIPASGLPKESPTILELMKIQKTSGIVYIETRSLWKTLFVEIIKGFYPFYLLFSIPVIWSRIKKKEWTRMETVVMSCVWLHTLVLIIGLGGTWIQKRYVIPVVPIMLGWTAIGVLNFFNFLFEKFRRGRTRLVPKFIMVLAILILIWDGTKKIRPTSKDKKRERIENVKACANWISTKGRKLIQQEQKKLQSTNVAYSNGLLPVIMSADPQVTYLANATSVHPTRYKRSLTLQELDLICSEKEINFIFLDRNMTQICSELSMKTNVNFKVIYKKESKFNNSVYIIVYVPNLTL